eukprot:s1_g1269.t1
MVAPMTRTISTALALLLASGIALASRPAHADDWFLSANTAIQHVDGLIQPGSFSDITTQTPVRASDRRLALSGSATQVFDLTKRTVIRPFVSGAYVRHDDFGAFDYLAFSGGAELFSHLTPDDVLRVAGTYTRSFTGRSQNAYAHEGNLLVGLSHHFANRLALRAEVSGTLVRYDRVAGANGQALEVMLVPQYVLADVPVGVYLRLSAATFDADSAALSHDRLSVSPSILWTPSRQWEFSVSGGFHSLDFDGPDSVQTTVTRDDDVYALGLNGRYRVFKDLTLHVDAGFQDRDSNISRQNYQTRLISIGVDFAF